MRQAVDKYLDNALTKDYLRYKVTAKKDKIIRKLKQLPRPVITISLCKKGGVDKSPRFRSGETLTFEEEFPVGSVMIWLGDDIKAPGTWERLPGRAYRRIK